MDAVLILLHVRFDPHVLSGRVLQEGFVEGVSGLASHIRSLIGSVAPTNIAPQSMRRLNQIDSSVAIKLTLGEGSSA
jgi:hypothetical protein